MVENSASDVPVTDDFAVINFAVPCRSYKARHSLPPRILCAGRRSNPVPGEEGLNPRIYIYVCDKLLAVLVAL